MICNQNHWNGPNVAHNMTFCSLGGGHIEKEHKKGVASGKIGPLKNFIQLNPNEPKYLIKSTLTIKSQFWSHCL